MAHFRKKPVVIEAAVFDGERVGDVVIDVDAGRVGVARSCPDWFPAVVREVTDVEEARKQLREGEVVLHENTLLIGTLEGVRTASAYDWIIRGVQGELYPCKPDIFEATYVPA